MPIPHLTIVGAEPPSPPPPVAAPVKPSSALPPPPPRAPRPPRRRGRPGLRSSVAILILLVVVLIVSGAATAVFAFSAKAATERATDDAGRLAFEEARTDLTTAESAFVRGHAAFAPWKLFTWLPWAGAQISALDHALAAGASATGAARAALGLGEEILSLAAGADLTGKPSSLLPTGGSLAAMSRAERRAVLEKLLNAGETIRDIQERVAAADAELQAIPETGVSAAILAAVAPFRDRIAKAAQTLAAAGPLTRILPRVAGYPTPKTYLFFLANNTELRPSAGFFGSYGILKVADGEIVSLQSDDIYNLDFPAAPRITRQAPAPIQKYLGVKQWFLRDANWSPDFAESAKTALTLYRDETAAAGVPDARPDGVIVVTPDLVSDLLAITGPVTVDGIAFTPENLVSELEYQVELAYLQTGVPKSERKEIMGKLLQEVVRKLAALPAGRWGEVLGAVEESLRGKQALFYDDEPALQAQFEEYGWAGRVAVPKDDGLLVVDANLAALKTDAVMKRAIRYAIRPGAGGTVTAQASVAYANTGRFTPFTTRYRTYVRFYVPKGSKFLRAEGQLAGDKLANPKRLPGTVDVYDELGRTVFGMFTSIEPGESRTVTVEYALPRSVADSIKDGEYRLLVEKQSGAQTYPLTLDLGFGKTVRRATPAEASAAWGDGLYAFTTDLAEDREFTVGF